MIITFMDSAAFEQKLNKACQAIMRRDFLQGFNMLQRLIKKRPRTPYVWINYGCAAAGLGLLSDAVRAWDKAREYASHDPNILLQLGHHYESVTASEKALHCFRDASTLAPFAINPRISQAILFERKNRLDEARLLVKQCFEISPQDEQARFFTALLDHHEGKIESAERLLRDLIKSDVRHPYVKYACRYELAQVLDRIGLFDEAMVLLAEAKKIVCALADIEALFSQYDRLAMHFKSYAQSLPQNVLSKWRDLFPDRSRESIPTLAFLGGHPRSGTTLVEQIIGAHPSIKAYDETQAFSCIIQSNRFSLGDSGNHSHNRLNILRREYIACLQQHDTVGSRGKLLLDKNPSLTAYIPDWLKIFPELRVIIALRDPRDVIISCYFQNIPLNCINANFLSIDRLARHYSDLMSVWLIVRNWKEFAWIETRYEDIVSNIGAEGQRVTKFFGLEWHEDQAHFYRDFGKHRVSSPTYHNVAQPLYSRSIARWHSYERYLSPIQKLLEPFCIAFGYS